MTQKGTVYLVGSGPGDYGLLTIRAKELIEKADILIYDYLVNPRILDLCSENCEKIYVGKSGAHHTMEQEDINRLLCEKAKSARVIVRLKGGDPFIFGRGGEEALALVEENIPFEIVNGVSSAYAAPSYAGIPVTHRGISSSVAFITGHEDPEKDDTDINWENLATGVQTLVFLMGVKNLPIIVDKLQTHGRSPETPIALIHRGTYASQRTVSGTLANIVQKVNEYGLKPPSIIIIGEVVALRDSISWFDRRPLFGKTIVVTRAREQASELTIQLQEVGADVIEVPSIKITGVNNNDEISVSLDMLEEFNWIIFTSVNGVEHFFIQLYKKGKDSRVLHHNKFCAIGPATAKKLNDFGIIADAVPQQYVSHRIVELLDSMNEIRDKSFLLPRADIAPPVLREELLKSGARQVKDITIYETKKHDLDNGSEAVEILSSQSYDLVTFTSSSTVKNYAGILQSLGINDYSTIHCAAIGPVTAQTAKEVGFTVDIVAEEHTIPGLVKAVAEFFKK